LDLDPLGRRELFVGAGGAFLCTLAGQRVLADRGANVAELAAQVPVPPKVRAAERAGATSAAGSQLAANRAEGGRREYWIRAEPVRWNIVPTGRDGMMDRKVKGETKFAAYAYRAYSPGFAAPLGPPTIPGPLIEAETGDSVVVNFQNAVDAPVTIHPHGVFYSQEMDGAYKGRHTDPGGFVEPKRTFQYVWEAREGTEGAWLYHDHGPIDPLPVFKGLFGPMLIRKAGAPLPTREFNLTFHSFSPIATGLRRNFSCINGGAYAGNTPTLTANVGESVAFNVFALDNDFHTFHIHGHRWTDPAGKVIDNQTLGPGDSITAAFVEDNPGRWFYHCHVFSHLHEGMNGWYLVG
jgi:FtsP/CotA-like multicopper oxidase with cupredoxin domain